MEPDFAEFEKRNDIIFSDKTLLKQAFLHRSYLNEHRELELQHNERLEFLGDAVLELVITGHLFKTFPDKPEGELTSYRAALVNTVTLSGVAGSLAMGDYLLLSKGEAKDTGRARQYILANTYEAFVGALYLDRGYAAAEKFIHKTIVPLTDEVVKKRLWQDDKSRFQEEAQERVSTTPTYQTLNEVGPDHDKQFVVGVFLDDVCVAKGEGKSKQEAEQDAAKNALKAKDWE